MSLQGQQVVIVGGSSGIGRAVAQATLAAGAHVTLMGRSLAKLRAASTQLGSVATVAMDINDETQVNHAFAPFEQIDHVYIAAGTTQLSNILDGTIAEQMNPLVERLWGSVHVVRAAMPKMASDGSVTFTGAVSTDRPVPGAWAVGVATAAAEQLARVLALELAPVRFNAIAPGYTDTPMWDEILGESKAGMLNGVAERLLTKRIATPGEVAQAVVLLMTNRSITGEVLHVDGGARLI